MSTSYLTKERTDLNAPGYLVDSVYYTNRSTEVQLCEIDYTTGKYTQSLNSLNFGSVSNIVIPNDNLVSDVYLSVRLPDLVENQAISKGWLFDLVSSINFTFGASNVSNLRIDSKTIRHLNLVSAETKEKREEIESLAGEYFKFPAGGAGNQFPIEGVIKIPLPWCNESADRKKPMDMSLLNSPVQIQITLDTADRIYSLAGAMPVALLSGEVFTTMGQFADKSNSLKQKMMMDPTYIYEYPFIYHQSVSPKSNIVLDSTLTSPPSNIDIQEMLNSDLTAILFSVHPTALQRKVGASITSPGLSCELWNVELKYNGSIIYKVPGRASRLVAMAHDVGATGFSSVIPNAAGDAIPHPCFVYHIPLGQMKGINFHRLFENVSRYPSQTFQLSFQAAQIKDDAGNVIGGNVGTLYLTYCYNSSASIQNGTTSIMFG